MTRRLYKKYGKIIIDPKIYAAILKIPRHIFMLSEFRGDTYDESKPFPITKNQYASSTEVVLSQISWLGPENGDHILMYGAKGGYIQSLLAELVGHNGQIDCISSDKEAINRNKEIIQKFTPYHSQISWFEIEFISDDFTNSRIEIYDKILICGAISGTPRVLHPLLKDRGILVAPISIPSSEGKKQQKLICYTKKGKRFYKTEISDVLYIFGPVF